ncbi:MAG: VWA domain-containing protein [Polyangiaceae bacterium]|nr:VWA domain-containing protein [Polyangiaceae bacterium]
MTRRLALTILLLALAVACSDTEKGSGSPSPSGGPSAAPGKAAEPVTLVVAYGSEKKTWLEEQAKKFESSPATTRSGRPIKITGQAMGSGEAVQGIVGGTLKPHVFSPASAIYITLLNSAWMTQTGKAKPISPAGDALVLSPIVVAMWKPMAEALGWPGKQLGWGDLLKVNADPKGWGAFGHPEWGRFKLGHTHPEYSSSGLLAVLAEAYAGAKKTRGLTAADLDAKATVERLREIEQTIVHYGKSTGFFSDKMLERGPAYLSASVLYENLVIESYSKPDSTAPFPIVAIYPVEGTFWSDHPYAVLDADWVGAEERDAAQVFLKFLKDKPQQERALALGFRPADPAIAINAPVDAAHGVDPKQPQTLLEVPDGPTLEKLLAVWRDAKKSSDVILVFDKSGSMGGTPLAEAKKGAKSFLDILHDRDDVTLIFFDGKVYPAVGPKQIGKEKAELVARIDATIADGQTALYDATAEAHKLALERAKKEPARIHAVVVMTDGKDEGSAMSLPALLGRFSEEEAPVKVFTIAYGQGADPTVLQQIADKAKGSTARGATDTIVAVYKDIAAFF